MITPEFTNINQALEKEARRYNVPSSYESPSNLTKGEGLENFRTA